ncbi:L-cysteine desulfidase family protein [Companilactobacillus hulinensis]|uniref:L-cysteine desulfidase family protein n=1 Tax=Companilactobacillus hulinensis TaxID=2486007 RepID=UPI000F7823C1|nr:L-serine ammonia-lyase, iron-sulfur-dependent, subunit alpha [Companilactobacillus hulinensis]
MNLEENTRKMLLTSLRVGVVAATGCTEPIAVAYAAANCMAYLHNRDIQKVEVAVSQNVMKNALAVIVPGTGRPGLVIAAATGIVAGDASAGLSVIADLKDSDLPDIYDLTDSGNVKVKVADVDDDLYVEVSVTDKEDTVRVCIAGSHTNIFLVQKNGENVFAKERPAAHEVSATKQFLQTIKLADIWEFCQTEPLENIEFMKKSADLNMALVEDGLKNDYGLKLGKSLNNQTLNAVTDDLSSKMVSYTAAASDARMGGSQLPAMSNSGSGNQGISATVPVCVVADYVKADDERLIKALTLSHLTALYIHAFLPVLSAFCATDSAAMGAAAGSIYLLKNDYQMAISAIQNMIGDSAGMVCDGAGCSCAMKVATSISSMYRSVNLAIQGITIPASNGLIYQNVDDSIRGLGTMVTKGFKQTDPTILEVMMNK